MALRYPHFLFLFTLLSAFLFFLSLGGAVQVALRESPLFSAAIVRQGLWDEVADFVSQLPPHKLFYIFLTHNPLHVLILLQVIINGLLLIGWLLQRLLFASCTAAEVKAAREAILNFCIFRLIFLGSLLETSSAANPTAAAEESSSAGNSSSPSSPPPLAPGSGGLREVCVWLLWFALVAFVRWFLVMLRERFNTAQASPHATPRTFSKYLLLTLLFSAVNLALAALVLLVLGPHVSWTVLSLVVFENAVLLASCVKIAVKYALYLQTLRRSQPWEERGSSLYYNDMFCEVVVQMITIAHLTHIWTHFGLSFSLLDLFLFLQVRHLAVGLYRNLKSVRQYARAIAEINTRFPDATPQELQQLDDVCSICRDTMEQAKRLPCGHLFHRSCLQQWIEHASFCPSCRAPLLPRNAAAAPAAGNAAAAAAPPNGAAAAARAPAAAHLGVILGQHQAALAQVQRTIVQMQQQQPQPEASGDQTVRAAAPESHSPTAIHSPNGFGLRHRGHVHAAGTHADGAHSPHSHSHSPAASSSSPHSHSHWHGAHSHSHSHASSPSVGSTSGATSSSVFKLDTRGSRWLPHFSFEAKVQRSGGGSNTPAATAAALDDEQPPPLEPMEPRVEQAGSSTAASLDAASTASPAAAATSPSLSLRDRIFEATQRRLAQESNANAATSSSVPASASAAPSSASASALPASPSTAASVPLPGSTSPPMLSQAEADERLARQMQLEEQMLAAEEERNRQGGGGLARFFTAL